MGSTSLWLPLASGGIAVLGTLGGVLITQRGADRREDRTWRRKRVTEQEDQWTEDRRSYYRPLREAAHELEERLKQLAGIYRREPGAGFDPGTVSADFRELYILSRDPIEPIEKLYEPGTDPNQPRRDDQAVQQLRTRMCRELNFATTSVYRAARFLALAQVTRRLLDEDRTSLPKQSAKQFGDQLAAVSKDWQGPSGAGLPTEQQESIGEMMLTPDGRVITQFEFRQRLLELPGWEQYTALLTFFITFGPKVDYEVLATVTALCTLIASLDQITTAGRPPPGLGE
jgi:hypothetical protein